MGNLSRKIEILGKNQKKRSRGQKHCNRDEDTTKERKVYLEDITIETSKTEKQRAEKTEKTQNRNSKNSGSTTEGIPYT